MSSLLSSSIPKFFGIENASFRGMKRKLEGARAVEAVLGPDIQRQSKNKTAEFRTGSDGNTSPALALFWIR
jgi:hypothetical protein